MAYTWLYTTPEKRDGASQRQQRLDSNMLLHYISQICCNTETLGTIVVTAFEISTCQTLKPPLNLTLIFVVTDNEFYLGDLISVHFQHQGDAMSKI